MNTFNLPDLGEGLPDAEIHEWFVKVGDKVTVDQALVSMETAKAVVDVPCPQSGVITTLHGQPGDIIKTGDPLVSFASSTMTAPDKGTVVGNLEESSEISEDLFTVGVSSSTLSRIKTTPAVKMLAKKLQVDLNTVTATGEFGYITKQDVENKANELPQLPEGYEPLRGVRRAMLGSMIQSHTEVVPVSLFDEADINAWDPKEDITVRLIKSIIYAAQQEPALNALFNAKLAARLCVQEVHLGLAMDNAEGLFVPVIHNAAQHSDKELRQTIDNLKISVQNRTVTADQLKGPSITLSNFGKFAGRFASPIIVPPMVAIVAVGKLYQAVVAEKNKPVIHNMIPISLSFDHRAVTGGEATRFLGALIEHLTRKS